MLTVLAYALVVVYAIFMVQFAYAAWVKFKITMTAKRLTKDIAATNAWLDMFAKANNIKLSDL